MDARETALLLGMASAYDGRAVGESEIVAWKEALNGIPFSSARDAVLEHYRQDARRIMPADITRIFHAERRAQIEEEHAREVLARAKAALPAGADPYEGQRNSRELEQLHATVNNVGPCEQCKAKSGDRCRRKDGVATKIPHFPRLKQAKKAGVDY